MRLTSIRVEDLIRSDDAAAEYGIPPAVLRKWVHRGRLRAFHGRHPKARVMYARPELEPLVRAYRATPQRRPKTAA